MSYVDLNPIRAGIAERPETSEFTSIQQRIREGQEDHAASSAHQSPGPVETPASPASLGSRLMPLVCQRDDAHANAIGFTAAEYLELVDWAGRQVRDDKRGCIPADVPPILSRLGLAPDGYLRHVGGNTGKSHSVVLGHIDHIRHVAAKLGRGFFKGLGQAQMLYLT